MSIYVFGRETTNLELKSINKSSVSDFLSRFHGNRCIFPLSLSFASVAPTSRRAKNLAIVRQLYLSLFSLSPRGYSLSLFLSLSVLFFRAIWICVYSLCLANTHTAAFSALTLVC